jgi:hypothetical protein
MERREKNWDIFQNAERFAEIPAKFGKKLVGCLLQGAARMNRYDQWAGFVAFRVNVDESGTSSVVVALDFARPRSLANLMEPGVLYFFK